MVSKIKILKEFENDSTYTEFNEILKDLFSIISKGKKTESDGEIRVGIKERQEDYKNILDIIPNLLEQKTNIESILYRKKCIMDMFAISDSIKGLKEYKDDAKLYAKFLDNLDNYFRLDNSDYTFIVPVNLVIEADDYLDDLNKIVNVFGLEILKPTALPRIVKLPTPSADNPNDLFVPDSDDVEKALKVMEDFPLLLKADIQARMRGYAHNEIIKRIKSFLGYIVYMDKYLASSEYFGDFDEYNIINLNYGPVLIIKDKMINWPILGLEDKLKTKLNLPNEVISGKKFNSMLDVCEKFLKEIKKETLKNLLFRSFSVYYAACSDKTLEYSFLKFWNITEYLIKSNSRVSDSELLNVMKQFFQNYLTMRVDFIYEKRNDLVHKGFTESITDSDRNLSKLMADLFINDAIIQMKNFNTRGEYEQHLFHK
ncbi:hypothetical protein [Methanobacterium subterraneum]|uniref:Apea-like HEPN domain-containing protein n=1 Tax=Methanobacterium subterraneum TaxID=59277 RepID=A0A2H4VD53_9EURY|nr:hypothetical protein [Methanobacterium subterraneum]AUB56033.1 hypothetical protein BK007_08500 [Methanobacterium subterraneum]NMO10219.1 hypothetical protein [Methanobacterium subterraneum]